MNITEPLRFAVGSHVKGSGKGCVMNVISYENGDTTITDMPPCSDPFLSRIMHRVNDRICTHRDNEFLCPECSMVVEDLGYQTVGTGSTGLSDLELQRVYVRIAAGQARSVLHLVEDEGQARAAVMAAEAWAETPTVENKNAAAPKRAAYAATAHAAITAARAAYAAAAAAAYAYYADDHAADAADYAYYADDHAADDLGTQARHIIAEFKRLTGVTPEPVSDETKAGAYQQMMKVSA